MHDTKNLTQEEDSTAAENATNTRRVLRNRIIDTDAPLTPTKRAGSQPPDIPRRVTRRKPSISEDGNEENVSITHSAPDLHDFDDSPSVTSQDFSKGKVTSKGATRRNGKLILGFEKINEDEEEQEKSVIEASNYNSDPVIIVKRIDEYHHKLKKYKTVESKEDADSSNDSIKFKNENGLKIVKKGNEENSQHEVKTDGKPDEKIQSTEQNSSQDSENMVDNCKEKDTIEPNESTEKNCSVSENMVNTYEEKDKIEPNESVERIDSVSENIADTYKEKVTVEPNESTEKNYSVSENMADTYKEKNTIKPNESTENNDSVSENIVNKEKDMIEQNEATENNDTVSLINEKEVEESIHLDISKEVEVVDSTGVKCTEELTKAAQDTSIVEKYSKAVDCSQKNVSSKGNNVIEDQGDGANGLNEKLVGVKPREQVGQNSDLEQRELELVEQNINVTEEVNKENSSESINFSLGEQCDPLEKVTENVLEDSAKITEDVEVITVLDTSVEKVNVIENVPIAENTKEDELVIGTSSKIGPVAERKDLNISPEEERLSLFNNALKLFSNENECKELKTLNTLLKIAKKSTQKVKPSEVIISSSDESSSDNDFYREGKQKQILKKNPTKSAESFAINQDILLGVVREIVADELKKIIPKLEKIAREEKTAITDGIKELKGFINEATKLIKEMKGKKRKFEEIEDSNDEDNEKSNEFELKKKKIDSNKRLDTSIKPKKEIIKKQKVVKNDAENVAQSLKDFETNNLRLTEPLEKNKIKKKKKKLNMISKNDPVISHPDEPEHTNNQKIKSKTDAQSFQYIETKYSTNADSEKKKIGKKKKKLIQNANDNNPSITHQGKTEEDVNDSKSILIQRMLDLEKQALRKKEKKKKRKEHKIVAVDDSNEFDVQEKIPKKKKKLSNTFVETEQASQPSKSIKNNKLKFDCTTSSDVTFPKLDSKTVKTKKRKSDPGDDISKKKLKVKEKYASSFPTNNTGCSSEIQSKKKKKKNKTAEDGSLSTFSATNEGIFEENPYYDTDENPITVKKYKKKRIANSEDRYLLF